MKIMPSRKWVVLDDGTTWPTPMDHADGSLEWRLRYDHQSRQDMMSAAAIISAYRDLILMPVKRRNSIMAALRIATKPPSGRGDG